LFLQENGTGSIRYADSAPNAVRHRGDSLVTSRALQVLKLLRYTAKLVLATRGVSEGSPAWLKLRALDSSLGTSRHAYWAESG